MQTENIPQIQMENHSITSIILERDVMVDCYLPTSIDDPTNLRLLIINDGQDLVKMDFKSILSKLYSARKIQPILCVAIHCSANRREEYGTAKILDYKGRGLLAAFYQQFIFEELLPYIRVTYNINSFQDKSICGFSMGGLSALDTAWNHPQEFTRVGVFSGSLWWRTVSQEDPTFDESEHRIMHNQIREGQYCSWLKFFFETGTQDESADRNNNGIIDAIDDTVSLIDELVEKGYDRNNDIKYVELSDGRHDVLTWAKAFPEFLIWGWGSSQRSGCK